MVRLKSQPTGCAVLPARAPSSQCSTAHSPGQHPQGSLLQMSPQSPHCHGPSGPSYPLRTPSPEVLAQPVTTAKNPQSRRSRDARNLCDPHPAGRGPDNKPKHSAARFPPGLAPPYRPPHLRERRGCPATLWPLCPGAEGLGRRRPEPDAPCRALPAHAHTLTPRRPRSSSRRGH